MCALVRSTPSHGRYGEGEGEKKFLVIASPNGEVKLLGERGTLFAGEAILGVFVVQQGVTLERYREQSPEYVDSPTLYQFTPFKVKE